MRVKRGVKVDAMSKKESQISWRGGKVISSDMIAKGSGNFEMKKSNNLSISTRYPKRSFHGPQGDTDVKLQEKDGCFNVPENCGLEAHLASSRTLKRSSLYCPSPLDTYNGSVQKRKAVEIDSTHSRHQRFVPALVQEKVDAVAYPQEKVGGKYMHSSSSIRSNRFLDTERPKLSDVVDGSFSRSSEPSDSDTDACSVGSCSVTSHSPNKFPYAESFHGSGEDQNCLFPPEEEVAASIHRLESHAYRCTLEAFYASGILSWEQEALLTNLRIMLHISNDEHLLELRSLISSGNGPHLEACIPCFQSLAMMLGFAIFLVA